jgi:hypothetical protein
LNKDTIKVGTSYQFMTDAHPIIYIKEINLPDDPANPGKKLKPDFS